MFPDISEKNKDGSLTARSISNYTPSDAEKKILESAKYKCACCGFQSRPSKVVPSGYMDIHKEKVVCRMCYGVLHADVRLDEHTEHGVIIYAPWITQKDLINLIRISFVPRVREHSTLSELSKKLEEQFIPLNEPLKKYDAAMSGSLEDFSRIVDNMTPEIQSKREHLLRGWRYFPVYAAYKNIMKYWDKASFAKLTDKKLEELLEQ